MTTLRKGERFSTSSQRGIMQTYSLPTFSGMHNRQSLTLKMVWKSFGDYDLMPLYFLGLVFGLAATPVAQCE